jgi:ribulose 1,5-bisphosphate carboxylase large subunit-like protein
MANTFVVNRLTLEKILTSFKVSSKNIDELSNAVNKMHRHVNAVAFVNMLHRYGIKDSDITNILRRIGVDDITITDIFNMRDEQRISETYGKIAELSID